MILVDTSIWIELLNGRLGDTVTDLHLEMFLTCGPVVQEVFQGLEDKPGLLQSFRQAFGGLPRLTEPLPERLFVAAADIYRQGRRRGFTIRSSTDCLIAAIAIENEVSVWHRDRDFDIIARFTNLDVLRELP